MCGIVGIYSRQIVNQLLYDGLQLLQHRGQDAAGIVTMDGSMFHMHKQLGMVRDVFRTRDMRNLVGNVGIAHVRYPTAGSAASPAEAQPFYVNSPFGIVLGHNGNLTNTEALQQELFMDDLRHVNTGSDSEVLLNVLAHELQAKSKGLRLDVPTIFAAVSSVHQRCRGAYAVVAMIAGYGLIAFRDPNGIRPLVVGSNQHAEGIEYLVASESVALDTLGFSFLRDIAPGEAVFIDLEANFYSQQCAEKPQLNPCIFEYVYFARPDSVMDGISVYATRLFMGEFLADKIRREWADHDIDVVIPIPDSSRPSALQLANHLGIPFREGFVKNRYIGRPFIMPGQATRRKSVRQKLNAISQEFKGRNVLLVDGKGQLGDYAVPMSCPDAPYGGEEIEDAHYDPATGRGYARLQLAPAYDPAAELLTYTREWVFEPDGRMRLIEHVRAAKPRTFTWLFQTYRRPPVAAGDDGGFTIRNGEATLELRLAAASTPPDNLCSASTLRLRQRQ